MRVSLARTAACLSLGALFGACTGPLPGSTETMESESVGCPIGSEGCPCTKGGTCDQGLVCASNKCVVAEVTTGPESTTDATTGTETSNATIAGECSPADDRPHPDQCGAVTPFCNAKGLCTDCTGIASCAAVDPSAPACDPSSGTCVECTANDAEACTGEVPICDPAAMKCRPCVAHADCPKSACDLDTGACFPIELALWVDGGAGCDDGGAGTEAAPLCTIKKALELIGAGPPGDLRAVRVLSGNYVEPLVVPAARVVAIVRAGAGEVQLKGVGEAALHLEAGSTLLLADLTVRGNTAGTGLLCDSAVLRLDSVTVAEHKSAGISGNKCALRSYGGIITRNAEEGLLLAAGDALLANTFVTENGTMDGEFLRGALALADGAKIEITYSTLVGNTVYIGGGYAAECEADAGIESVTIRNSIVFGPKTGIAFNCGDAESVIHSAISQEMDEPQDDNLGVTETEAGALVTTKGGEMGVYRPQKDSKLAGVAMPQASDPAADFEGTPRQGTNTYPGADEP